MLDIITSDDVDQLFRLIKENVWSMYPKKVSEQNEAVTYQGFNAQHLAALILKKLCTQNIIDKSDIQK